MARVLEIVLDVVTPFAPPPSNAPRPPDNADVPDPAAVPAAASCRAARSPAGAAALVFAEALPALVALPDTQTPTTVVSFDSDGALARAGWRVTVDTHDAARDASDSDSQVDVADVAPRASANSHRVVVSQRRVHTPGIAVVTPIFVAPLDASDVANALFDAAPTPFREALAATGALRPAATLHALRSRWQWPREGIDVLLTFDADLRAEPATPAASTVHEWRVSAAWPEGEDDAPLVAALFDCARELIGAMGPYAPAFVRDADAVERAASGDVAGDVRVARAEPVDLAGARSAADALVAICRNIGAQWFGNDAGVRGSANGEFIHQMRVAQRRLRTAMRLFAHWRDDAWKTQIEPELRWLGALLGDARDRDVFVDSTLPALAAADVDPARWTALRAEADARRQAARASLREALLSPRYALAALAWLQWLDALTRRARRADQDGSTGLAGERARPLRAHAKKRLRRYHDELANTPKLTAIDEASRHRVRINAKYLRYAVEFFAPIASRRTRTDLVRTLARLQSVLGDGNDAAVALRYLESMDAEPYQLGFARGWCEAVKRYTAKEGERVLRELPAPKVPRAD
ncbi:CHAD domain-containing protein [Paraburkholderia acidisoli]|uniref:CHAD domain-containing protein n=1 Tax=Paraburkholderia acidisoli TaxID=2571748 RepID=A0A7Z2GKT7_9BURK|nr:CHAD domain-containing protein [Paraburkholderia acidisoli]QGZ63648.1 CHAD domain-containing protein [Paraburkholderia acidisoli]